MSSADSDARNKAKPTYNFPILLLHSVSKSLEVVLMTSTCWEIISIGAEPSSKQHHIDLATDPNMNFSSAVQYEAAENHDGNSISGPFQAGSTGYFGQ